MVEGETFTADGRFTTKNRLFRRANSTALAREIRPQSIVLEPRFKRVVWGDQVSLPRHVAGVPGLCVFANDFMSIAVVTILTRKGRGAPSALPLPSVAQHRRPRQKDRSSGQMRSNPEPPSIRGRRTPHRPRHPTSHRTIQQVFDIRNTRVTFGLQEVKNSYIVRLWAPLFAGNFGGVSF